MPRQLVTNNLAVVLVVFDDKDADGIRLVLLKVAYQAGGGIRRFLLMARTPTHPLLSEQA